jgi:hypothetical protein
MSEPQAKLMHGLLKAAVKRSIIVMDAMGDSEMRFQNMGQVWSRAVDDAWLAYGSNETRVRFVPTAREIAQADTVAEWLAWLGANHGREHVKLLTSWAHDDPIWRIAERECCSERAVHNRINRAVALILEQFGGLNVDFPELEERMLPAHPPSFCPPIVPQPDEGRPIEQHAKVWLHGKGFMKAGKRLNNGQDRFLNGN